MAKPHAVAIPLPAQGHLNPLMRLCRALVSRHGFFITFVNIQPIHARILECVSRPIDAVAQTSFPSENDDGNGYDRDTASCCGSSSIQRVSIPINGLDMENDFRLSFADFLLATRSLIGPIESLLESIRAKGSGLPPVTFVISDIFMSGAVQGVAEKLSLPWVSYFPSSQNFNLLYFYTDTGRVSLQDCIRLSEDRNKPLSLFCDGLHGLPPLYNRDIPSYKHVVEESPRIAPLMVGLCGVAYKKASAIIVNSFEEIEGPAIRAMAEQLTSPKLFAVGPLVDVLEGEISTSLWREEGDCLQWLDMQPARSVLYISFGSITLLSEEQFTEILEGLRISGHRFLWSFRPDLVQRDHQTKNQKDEVLPVELLRAVKDRSFFVQWAPQMHVLNHPSVGGFLTHCGWNSVIEALAAGVPILCWPYLCDQHLDSKFVVEIWQVGLRFESLPHRADGLVGSQEVARLVRALMDGEEGILLRKRSAFFRDAALRCLQADGSFDQQLEAFVQHISSISPEERE